MIDRECREAIGNLQRCVHGILIRIKGSTPDSPLSREQADMLDRLLSPSFSSSPQSPDPAPASAENRVSVFAVHGRDERLKAACVLLDSACEDWCENPQPMGSNECKATAHYIREMLAENEALRHASSAGKPDDKCECGHRRDNHNFNHSDPSSNDLECHECRCSGFRLPPSSPSKPEPKRGALKWGCTFRPFATFPGADIYVESPTGYKLTRVAEGQWGWNFVTNAAWAHNKTNEALAALNACATPPPDWKPEPVMTPAIKAADAYSDNPEKRADFIAGYYAAIMDESRKRVAPLIERERAIEEGRYPEPVKDTETETIATLSADLDKAKKRVERLEYALRRKACGCVAKDCTRHGSYVPDEVRFYDSVVKDDPGFVVLPQHPDLTKDSLTH